MSAPQGFPEGGVVWAAPPPPGVTRNTVNPESLGPMSIGIVSTFIALATIFVFLRLYVRIAIQKAFSWDDGCSILALMLQIVYTGIEINLCVLGLIGRHIWETPLIPLFTISIKQSEVLADLQPMALLFTKLSLLLLYLRVFGPNKLVKFGTWIGIAVCVPLYAMFMFVWIFLAETSPLEVSFNHAFGIVNFLTDLYILVLPALAIGSLQMKTSKKLGLIAVFTAGLAGVVMGILGMVYRFQFQQQNQATDSTWQAVPRFTVNMVEVDVGIICGCMPITAALFRKGHMPEIWLTHLRSLGTRLLSTRRSTSTQGSKGSKIPANGSQASKKSDYVELTDGSAFRKGSQTDTQSGVSESSTTRQQYTRRANWE